MAVEINTERKAVELKWDPTALEGDVMLKCTNPANEDVSVRQNLKNDGYATVTFPADYKGKCHVVISDSELHTEEGDITIK